MKIAKAFYLAGSALLGVTAGGIFGINSFVHFLSRKAEEKTILWETVRVLGDSSKVCTISEELHKLESLRVENNTLKTKALESSPEVTKNSCSTYWSSSIARKDKKDTQSIELWIRAKGKEVINEMIKNESFGGVKGFEKDSKKVEKLEDLLNECKVSLDIQNGWTVVECPKN